MPIEFLHPCSQCCTVKRAWHRSLPPHRSKDRGAADAAVVCRCAVHSFGAPLALQPFPDAKEDPLLNAASARNSCWCCIVLSVATLDNSSSAALTWYYMRKYYICWRFLGVCDICLSWTQRFSFVIVHHGSRRRPGHNSLEQTTLMAELLLGEEKGEWSRTDVSPSGGQNCASHEVCGSKMQEADEKLTHLL